jgi:hypothetical protein
LGGHPAWNYDYRNSGWLHAIRLATFIYNDSSHMHCNGIVLEWIMDWPIGYYSSPSIHFQKNPWVQNAKHNRVLRSDASPDYSFRKLHLWMVVSGSNGQLGKTKRKLETGVGRQDGFLVN